MISTMEITSGVSSFLYSKYQSLFYMILIFLISKVLGFNAGHRHIDILLVFSCAARALCMLCQGNVSRLHIADILC